MGRREKRNKAREKRKQFIIAVQELRDRLDSTQADVCIVFFNGELHAVNQNKKRYLRRVKKAA
jgi:hypothetical protein